MRINNLVLSRIMFKCVGRVEPDSPESITSRKIAIIQNYQYPLHQTVREVFPHTAYL